MSALASAIRASCPRIRSDLQGTKWDGRPCSNTRLSRTDGGGPHRTRGAELQLRSSSPFLKGESVSNQVDVPGGSNRLKVFHNFHAATSVDNNRPPPVLGTVGARFIQADGSADGAAGSRAQHAAGGDDGAVRTGAGTTARRSAEHGAGRSPHRRGTTCAGREPGRARRGP